MHEELDGLLMSRKLIYFLDVLKNGSAQLQLVKLGDGKGERFTSQSAFTRGKTSMAGRAWYEGGNHVGLVLCTLLEVGVRSVRPKVGRQEKHSRNRDQKSPFSSARTLVRRSGGRNGQANSEEL
jgi:hypothetical protein